MNKELENILVKVGELYNNYGIKSVTMDDVARELGISKKTLYQYVENKNDLVSKVLDYMLDLKNCSFKEITEKDQNAIEALLEVGVYIIKSINDYNSSTLYDLKKYYPELSQKFHNIRKERMYNAIIKNIEKGKNEGLYRIDMNTEIIAKIQTSRFIHMSSGDFFDRDEMLKPQYVMELFIYHIRGIANSKGIEVLEKTLEKIDIQEYLH
ncbi:TetR/AcrR family transcriptional regulator [Bacteroidota bacterium]